MPKNFDDPFWYFVDLHNERIRNYWNYREQSISCRARSTRSGNASNFRKNVIQYIYNKNILNFRELLLVLSRADEKIINNTFGITKIDQEIRKITEKLLLVRIKLKEKAIGFEKEDTWLISIDNWERELDNLKKKRFEKTQEIRNSGISDILSILELDYVVSTKLLGYYKELFFLKCYYNDRNPQVVLRTLYHLDTNIDWLPEEYDKENYREEIIEIIENYLKEKDD